MPLHAHHLGAMRAGSLARQFWPDFAKVRIGSAGPGDIPPARLAGRNSQLKYFSRILANFRAVGVRTISSPFVRFLRRRANGMVSSMARFDSSMREIGTPACVV